MVQFNTPYSATPALAAFLSQRGINVVQADLALEFALRIFSRQGLRDLLHEIRRRGKPSTPGVRHFVTHATAYQATVGDVIRLLQQGPHDGPGSGSRSRKHPTQSQATNDRLRRRVLGPRLPRGPRFALLEDLASAGIDPAATDPEGYPRLLASLYLDDLADIVQQGVDGRFGLSRYAERLALSAPSFTPLLRSLREEAGLLDRILEEETVALLNRVKPDLVGITLPFPGNVYAAFRIARQVKEWNPSVRTVAGGGYVSTELRHLSDPRVFDFFDFVTYDDGEQPLLRIVEYVAGTRTRDELVRTRLRIGRRVVFINAPAPAVRHRDRPTPGYDGLPLDRYCGIIESLNPMHRLWTERRWMKLPLAHGCYWHRCAFCDTKLDYIARYDPADVDTLIRWIGEIKARTGEDHLHFVDEAAPPALLHRLASALVRRRVRIRWWANIRFEESFTPELAAQLARSGCLALTGGLECAHPQLLATMNKGVSLPGAARAMHALSQAGILVHAYLMYGFPRQTVQQTVDALEVVRQLFVAGCLHSAYWHRFALTVHSPIFSRPERFGVRSRMPSGTFAQNEVRFTDGRRVDHARLGKALHRATYNYMHGVGLDADVRTWFERRVPHPRVAPHWVDHALDAEAPG
jgi:hypothetical protein